MAQISHPERRMIQSSCMENSIKLLIDVEEACSQGSEESVKPLSGSSCVSYIPTGSGRSREDGWRKAGQGNHRIGLSTG